MTDCAFVHVNISGAALRLKGVREDNHETQPELHPLPFSKHCDWQLGTTWKSALNNLRLLLQPYWCWAGLEQWLQVFPVPGLKRALHQLMDWMDTFQILPIPDLKAA